MDVTRFLISMPSPTGFERRPFVNLSRFADISLLLLSEVRISRVMRRSLRQVILVRTFSGAFGPEPA